jgi:SNF2 family DNA or RNA helicase
MPIKKEVKLHPHQIESVLRHEDHPRTLMSHGTGTGKTLSSIAATESLRDSNRVKKTLVITPASLRSNFIEKGVNKFTDGRTASKGVDGKSDYQVISFAALRKEYENILNDSKADNIIVDEIHRAKDPRSKTYKALQRVSSDPRVKSLIGLTGSPISNHPRDIVPLATIVDPSNNIGSQQSFSGRHIKNLKEYKGFLRPRSYKRKLVKKDRLNKDLSHIMHTVTHEQSGQLPRLKIEDVKVEMSPLQKKIYDYSLNRLSPSQRAAIRSGALPSSSESMHMFSLINNSRKSSNSLKSFGGEETTPKMKQMVSDVEAHLKKDKQNKAIVYSNFIEDGVEEAKQLLQARGHNVATYTGRNTKTRDSELERFKNKDSRVIVMSPAGSEGVSLDNATGFFELDRHYNPEKNQQAIARGRRIGGQSHRKPEDRELEVKRYFSTPPRSWWQKLIGSKEVGVEEWIDSIAKSKNEFNEDFRKAVKKK